MTLVWIILELMFLFLFFHLPTADDIIANDSSSDLSDNKSESNGRSQTCTTEKVDDEKNVCVTGHEQVDSNFEDAVSESEPILQVHSNHENDGLIETRQLKKDYGSINIPKGSQVSRNAGVVGKVQFILSEFITEQVTLLLGLLFITQFNQLVLEVILLPILSTCFFT